MYCPVSLYFTPQSHLTIENFRRFVIQIISVDDIICVDILDVLTLDYRVYRISQIHSRIIELHVHIVTDIVFTELDQQTCSDA